MELVLVDTSQIQAFIFGSNRLRENAGASLLVSQATEDWPKEFLGTNSLIYSGGGNVLLEFGDPNEATAFIRKFSEKVIEEAPGLQIAFAQRKTTDNFHEDYKSLQRQLREGKRSGKTSAPLLGLGVTRRCQSTGLPANGIIPETENDTGTLFSASMEVIIKNEAGKKANERLNGKFKSILGDQYEFPRQLDNLGRSEGEHSYIAVVHIDGDGMGQRIEKLIEESQNSKAALDQLNQFSNTLKDVGDAALQKIVQMLVDSVKDGKIIHRKDSKEIAKVQLAEKKDKAGKVTGHFLPFRPIIYGGDDLTFVCDGRLGIALALAFMQEFEKQSEEQKLPGGKATSCAGIAIVKVHYPFARAYGIAEELCKGAKKYKRENSLNCACFDWHFALSGLSGDLEAIREKEYRAQFDARPWLHLRPYALGENPDKNYQTWQNLEVTVKAFQNPKDWLERRNKLHALETALRQGPEHVTWFRQKYNDRKELPNTKTTLDGWKDSGWGWDKDRQCCGYFDALELADWYMPLVNEKGVES